MSGFFRPPMSDADTVDPDAPDTVSLLISGRGVVSNIIGVRKADYRTLAAAAEASPSGLRLRIEEDVARL